MSDFELSEWATDLGLSVPIVCAPMGGVAGGRLASAVSLTGALGMVGMGSTGSLELLERELGELEPAIRDDDEAPFGIGMVDWVMSANPGMLDVALDAQPGLLSVSFGDWSTRPAWIAEAQARGIRTIAQVASTEEAKAAEAAGVGAIVARGREGGGHGAPLEDGRRLLDEVLVAVDIPVLAAGALATAAAVRAVIDTGAAAAWVGTAFAACPESLTKDDARAQLLAASGADATYVTRDQDIAKGYAWPEQFPDRVLRADPSVNAGQGVGELTAVRTAREVVDALWPR